MKLQVREKPERADARRREEVLNGLCDVRDRMESVQSIFQNVNDPELIDACIFEINALQARYVYFLNCARMEQIEVAPVFKQRERYS